MSIENFEKAVRNLAVLNEADERLHELVNARNAGKTYPDDYIYLSISTTFYNFENKVRTHFALFDSQMNYFINKDLFADEASVEDYRNMVEDIENALSPVGKLKRLEDKVDKIREMLAKAEAEVAEAKEEVK